MMSTAEIFPPAHIENAGLAGPSGVENNTPAHIENAGMAGPSGVENSS